MDPVSPVDSPAATERSAPLQRFSGRASGTRRIVTPERDSVASVEPVAAPGQPGLLQRTLDGCWRLDERLRGRLLWLLVAGAAAVGGAVPLLMSWTGVELLGALAAGVLELTVLVLAGLTWAARSRPTAGAWQLSCARSRLLAQAQLAAADARWLPRAPKSLKLSILSRWTRGAGLLGLVASNLLSVAAQLLGGALPPALAGISLWSVSLLLLAELLRSALRVQAPRGTEAALDLALAAREFAPVIDLSAPLELETVFLEPTPLHDVLEGLSTWRAARHWRSAEDHAAALQHHLWATRMPDARLERRRRLGSAAIAADLIVDDAVLIDFQLGLEAEDTPRIAERVRSYRRAWADKPIVIVVCPAVGGEPPAAATLEALVAELDSAPLLVAVAR